jgi:hypothetical protein
MIVVEIVEETVVETDVDQVVPGPVLMSLRGWLQMVMFKSFWPFLLPTHPRMKWYVRPVTLY